VSLAARARGLRLRCADGWRWLVDHRWALFGLTLLTVVSGLLGTVVNPESAWAQYLFSSLFQGFAALLGIVASGVLISMQLASSQYGSSTAAAGIASPAVRRPLIFLVLVLALSAAALTLGGSVDGIVQKILAGSLFLSAGLAVASIWAFLRGFGSDLGAASVVRRIVDEMPKLHASTAPFGLSLLDVFARLKDRGHAALEEGLNELLSYAFRRPGLDLIITLNDIADLDQALEPFFSQKYATFLNRLAWENPDLAWFLRPILLRRDKAVIMKTVVAQLIFSSGAMHCNDKKQALIKGHRICYWSGFWYKRLKAALVETHEEYTGLQLDTGNPWLAGVANWPSCSPSRQEMSGILKSLGLSEDEAKGILERHYQELAHECTVYEIASKEVVSESSG